MLQQKLHSTLVEFVDFAPVRRAREERQLLAKDLVPNSKCLVFERISEGRNDSKAGLLTVQHRLPGRRLLSRLDCGHRDGNGLRLQFEPLVWQKDADAPMGAKHADRQSRSRQAGGDPTSESRGLATRQI